jgi:hypothetical protein
MKFSAFKPAAGKLLLFLAILLGFGPLSLAAEEVPSAKVAAAYREAKQFYRISEFFTGRERTGGDIVLRSDLEERAGYYFTVRLPHYPYKEETADAIHLQVILPGDVEATLFKFPLGPHRKRNPLILVGLTGQDWPDAKAVPLAWQITFFGSDGQILARQKSFLWGNK